MIIVIRKANPGVIWATHTDHQIAEVLAGYPAEDFDAYQIEGYYAPFDPTPAELPAPLAAPEA